MRCYRAQFQLVTKLGDWVLIGIDFRKSGFETGLIKFRQCGEWKRVIEKGWAVLTENWGAFKYICLTARNLGVL